MKRIIVIMALAWLGVASIAIDHAYCATGTGTTVVKINDQDPPPPPPPPGK